MIMKAYIELFKGYDDDEGRGRVQLPPLEPALVALRVGRTLVETCKCAVLQKKEKKKKTLSKLCKTK